MPGEDIFIPVTPGEIPARAEMPQFRPQEAAPPPDPSEFFHVAPGIPADHPDFEPDRKAWWEDFVGGYYQQNFRNLNDYIEFVGGLGSDPGVDAFAKQQALKHMPPKLKAEYEALQAEKQEQRDYDRQVARMEEFNERMKKKNLVMGFDGKVQALKTDPEIEPYNKQIELSEKIIKALNDKEKGTGTEARGKLTAEEKAMRTELQRGILEAFSAIRGIQTMREEGRTTLREDIPGRALAGEEIPEEAKEPVEVYTPASVLAKVRANPELRDWAIKIAKEKGWK